MNNKLILSLIVAGLIGFFLMSTGLSCKQPAEIKEIVFTDSINESSKKPNNEKTEFSQNDEKIYLTLKLINSLKPSEIKVKWKYIESDFYLGEKKVETEGNRYLAFSIERPESGWPEGEYLAEVFLNERKIAEGKFEIKK